jgi:hypothetical protein
MTRAFVVKYGANELLADSLHAHFRSRGWSGNASDMYRRLREEAREWLSDEKDGNAIRWLDEYISGLGYSIERAEMEEERRG